MLRCVYEQDNMMIYKAVLPPVGVNTYLLYMQDHLFVIDPGITSAELPEMVGRSYQDLSIVITHSHFDHIAGIDDFDHAEILITQAALPGLYDPAINLSGDLGGGMMIIKNKNTRILSLGENTIHGCSFQVMIFPGHTQGDSVFDFGPFLFTGDFIFSDSIGRTDFRFSNHDAMKQSIKKFKNYLSKKQPSDLILPGHMNVCTVEELLDQNPFLSLY